MGVEIKKAERKQAKLRLGIAGPSGSGKTYTALLLAFGIGSRVLLADTEEKSASLYADMDEGPLAGRSFDVIEIDPPYTIQKYMDAIEAAEKHGYDVLVLDSISHAWAGEGGLLDKKSALDSRGGQGERNKFSNWAAITKEQEQFIARMLHCGVHLIATMRSKQDYVLENINGKQVPRKVGMAPVQRDGMEYEFTAVLDMGMDHSAIATKHRTGKLLDGLVFTPGIETGESLLAWLQKGKPEEPKAKPTTPPPATKKAESKFAVNIPDPPSMEGMTPDELAKASILYILDSLKVAEIDEQTFLGWLFVIQGDKLKSWVHKTEDGAFTLQGGKIEDIALLAGKPWLVAAIAAYKASLIPKPETKEAK